MPALDLECAETQPPRGCCSATTGSSYYKYGQLGAPVEYRPPLLRGKPEIPWQRYVDASAAREAWSKRDSRRATVIVLRRERPIWSSGAVGEFRVDPMEQQQPGSMHLEKLRKRATFRRTHANRCKAAAKLDSLEIDML